MNKRERVIAAIQHEETECVPYHLRFTGTEREKIKSFTEIENVEEHFGNHIKLARCMDFPVEIAPGMYRDEFGVVWNRKDGSDIGLPVEYVLTAPTIDNFTFPKPVEEEIANEMSLLVHGEWDTFRAVNVGFSLYERAWSMRGIENLLMDMLQEEDFVVELLDRIIEYDILAMDCAQKASDEFDAFFLGDDWGQQTGLIMSKPLWKKLIGPRIARLVEHSKCFGKYTILHSCGKIIDLFDDLIDAGLDVYDTFQPEIYDIVQVKKKYGSRLTFLGGISTQTLLPNATPAVVHSTTEEIVGIMGKNGGYIAAPTHDVPSDVPVENILAMIAAFTGKSVKQKLGKQKRIIVGAQRQELTTIGQRMGTLEDVTVNRDVAKMPHFLVTDVFTSKDPNLIPFTPSSGDYVGSVLESFRDMNLL